MTEKKDFLKSYRSTIETTTYYEVGKLVAEARLSVKAALLLPKNLYGIFKRHQTLASSPPLVLSKKAPADFSEEQKIRHIALQVANGEQTAAQHLIRTCRELSGKETDLHSLLLEVAKITAASDANIGAELTKEALSIKEDAQSQKQLGFLLYQAGNLEEASRILKINDVAATCSKQEKIKAARIHSEAVIFSKGIVIPVPVANRLNLPSKTMYVCHTSFPFHTNGYAVRTHRIALAIKDLGEHIECVSRPGYPWDRKDALKSIEPETEELIDGIKYYRYRSTNLAELPLNEYIAQATETLIGHIREQNITHVIAASNYVNALPALIASRETGIPFIYDVRGIWEYTMASKIKDWENTERFHLARRLETQIADKADHVITLSGELKRALISRGVPAEKIQLALNATTAPIKTQDRKHEIRQELNIPFNSTVVGFIGSMEKYEGLDTLLKAINRLKKEGQETYAILVGDGGHVRHLHELCCELGLTKYVRFTGRLSYSKAQQYYSAVDICIYPRNPDKVCNIVPPLKPLEAMANGKPIIVSRLNPIIELIGGEDNAVVIRPNDAEDLHAKLSDLINDQERITELAARGLKFVSRQRTWSESGKSYLRAISFSTSEK